MDWWTGVNSCGGAGTVGGPGAAAAAVALNDMNQIDAGLFDSWIHCDDLDLGTILHQANGHSSAQSSVSSAATTSISSSTSTSVSSSSPGNPTPPAVSRNVISSSSSSSSSNNNNNSNMSEQNVHQLSNNSHTTQQIIKNQLENIASISSTLCSSSTNGSMSSLESSPLNNSTTNQNNASLSSSKVDNGSTTNSVCLVSNSNGNSNNQVCYLPNSPSSSSSIYVRATSSPILVQTSSLLVHDSTLEVGVGEDENHYNQMNQSEHHHHLRAASHLQQHNQYLSQQLNSSSNNLHHSHPHYQQNIPSTGPIAMSTTTITSSQNHNNNNNHYHHHQLINQSNRQINLQQNGYPTLGQHHLNIANSIENQQHQSHSIAHHHHHHHQHQHHNQQHHQQQQHLNQQHSIIIEHANNNGSSTDICGQIQTDSKTNLKGFLGSQNGSGRRSSYESNSDFNNNEQSPESPYRKPITNVIHVDDTNQQHCLNTTVSQQPQHVKRPGGNAKQSFTSMTGALSQVLSGPFSDPQQQQQRQLSNGNQRQNFNARATSMCSNNRKSGGNQTRTNGNNNNSNNNSKTNNSQQQQVDGVVQPKIRRCRHITDFVLGEEEKRLLIKEGYEDFPMSCQDGPLTRTEERILRKIRRKIRNKKSAQCSRQRKKEYVEELERKYANIFRENQELRKILETFQRDNQHQLILPGSSSTSSSPVPVSQQQPSVNNIIEWKVEQ